MPNENQFLRVIKNLYEHGEVVLFDGIRHFSTLESKEVVRYIEEQYLQECLEFPCARIPFDPDAAEYSAQIVYNALQLIIYREKEESELSQYITTYSQPIGAGSMLSADVCFRFLPDAIKNLQSINPEDELIELLENILANWHYSGISTCKMFEASDIDMLFENDCFRKLYIDRILTTKNTFLARHPFFRPWVLGALGMHKELLWKELIIDNENSETS